MVFDPRDELWEATFDTYYDAYYAELIADALIRRWQWVDYITRIVVAFTASGSAIAGWTLWQLYYGRMLWGVFAGFAAVLAIIHAALQVPERLKRIGEVQGNITALRADLETYRYLMKIDPNFPLEEFTRKFEEYRKRLASGVSMNDILLTSRLKTKLKDELNSRLKDEIVK